jgi:hypothetical protein
MVFIRYSGKPVPSIELYLPMFFATATVEYKSLALIERGLRLAFYKAGAEIYFTRPIDRTYRTDGSILTRL